MWRRLGKDVLIVVLLTWLIAGFLLFVLQRQLIFPGVGQAKPELAAWGETIGVRNVTLTTADGVELLGWVSESQRQRLLIFFHGNGGSVADSTLVHQDLREVGWDVLAISWRGYPGSTGHPTKPGLEEDARTTWRYATETLGFEPHRIAVHGHSLGGALAIWLASEVKPGALVADSTFTRLADVVQPIIKAYPAQWLLLDPFDSVAVASSVRSPTLVIHSTEDDLIPFWQGKALSEQIPGAVLGEVTGHTHMGFPAFRDDAMRSELMAFLDREIPLTGRRELAPAAAQQE